MSDSFSQKLLEAFSRLCEGEFEYRLPRTNQRDAEDTTAFLFNSVADELQRIIRTAQAQEERLASAVEKLSDALVRVASGDLTVQVERDFEGDQLDVLFFLVNNTVAELAAHVEENERLAREAQERLEHQVAERTAQLRDSEESFRRLFNAAPAAMILLDASDLSVRAANERAHAALAVPFGELEGKRARMLFDNGPEADQLLERVREEDSVEGVALRLRKLGADGFWALLSGRHLSLQGQETLMLSFADFTEHKEAEARLHELAIRDELTGVYNRRRFFERAAEELRRATRFQRPITAAMLDIDHFKSINDSFGHEVGDEALRLIGRTLQSHVRPEDVLARYGGEEFALILVEADSAVATAVLERLRAAICDVALIQRGQRVPLAVSIGAAERGPGEELSGMLRRADDALYQAKQLGRNRVVCTR